MELEICVILINFCDIANWNLVHAYSWNIIVALKLYSTARVYLNIRYAYHTRMIRV